jgi:hypothetical protein
VIRDRYVMHAALLRREAQVTAHLTRDLIAIPAQRTGVRGPTDRGGDGARCALSRPSGRDDFVVDEMEPDRLRSLGIVLVVVAADRLADHRAQLREVVCFGDDRGAHGVGDVAAFLGLFDDKTGSRSWAGSGG